MEYPRFQYHGSFGLQHGVEYSETVIRRGLRRRITVRTDDSRGCLSWRLVYKSLTQTADTYISTGHVVLEGDEGLGPQGTVLSRADYVWRFVCARKSGARASFRIKSLFDGLDYLAQFDEPRLTFEMMGVKLHSSGLLVVQVDEPDQQTLDDLHGSLGDGSTNPGQF
jgi:hypothetical protein